MTKPEFAKLMAFLTAVVDKPIARPTMDAYFEMLHDLPYDLATAAVKKIVATEEYPVLPTVGKIRRAAADLSRGNELSAPEAWGLAIRAIHKYGYYRETEALASLPPGVAQVIRWMGWQELCLSENADVIRGQFLRMFETQQKRESEQALLPPDLREVIGALADNLKMIEGGRK